jgi:hypothetical protein
MYMYRVVGQFGHEGLFSFALWTKSNSWESCQVAFHNWNSQWFQVSILYQNIEALYICPHILVPFSCGTKSQLVLFSLDLKNCIHFSVQFTWILCLIWWNLHTEFKLRNISANAVHVWQHLKGHWVEGEGSHGGTLTLSKGSVYWQNRLARLPRNIFMFAEQASSNHPIFKRCGVVFAGVFGVLCQLNRSSAIWAACHFPWMLVKRVTTMVIVTSHIFNGIKTQPSAPSLAVTS